MMDGTTRFKANGKTIYHYMGISSFSEYTVINVLSVAKVNKSNQVNIIRTRFIDFCIFVSLFIKYFINIRIIAYRVYYIVLGSFYVSYTLQVDKEAPLNRVCMFGCAISTGYGAVVNNAKVRSHFVKYSQLNTGPMFSMNHIYI